MDNIIFWLMFYIWIAAAITMAITWIVQLETEDASYVDVVWALGIGIASIYVFIFYSDYNLRKFLIFICPVFWSFRLSLYLIKRLRFLNSEDSRYQSMRRALTEAGKLNVGFFVFFQVQALFIVIFSLPIILSLLTDYNNLTVVDILGFCIFIMAFSGESIADKQLLAHKKNNGFKVTCQSGLWYYSRHPNYFFEWLHWFAYVCFCFYSPYFWIALIMPFLMLFFIVKLTGIPHVEREALNKKPDYKEYMASTPMLIPNFRKLFNIK